ncbi:phage terminase small subunit [Methylophaga sp. OBS4]|uniref:phage terminase small subunit n=1 Tax=Methylophaga sp. OBS4 TaxID=2991935 RepID=UPI00224C8DF5|nr:phage terminase small subunit [Methylophaga sp. OBS4]MCX4187176.1 phage terminase small subunit [Methylophaga sp. OBS4]
MSKFQRIKDAQIAEAEKAGLDNPYESGELSRRQRPERVSKLKQLQQLPPGAISYDPASAAGDTTVTSLATDNGTGQVLVVGDPASIRMFDQLKAAMETDLQRLKTKHTMEEKAELKLELLPNYQGFVDDYMANGHNYPNSIAVWVLIWLLDVGDIEKALDLGFYLIRTPKQDTPANFGRADLPTIICDAVYDWASAELKAGRSASPYLDQVVAVMLDENWQLSPPVASKMPAMLAKHEFAKENFENTVHWCEVAERLNPEGHGTKTMKKEALKKALAKAQAEGEK